jgi:hypothetical protein
MKLLTKPTKVQQSILEMMARGAVIVLHPPKRRPRRALTCGDDIVRAITARTLASMKFAGWIWSGPDRPCLVITRAGQAVIGGGVVAAVNRRRAD